MEQILSRNNPKIKEAARLLTGAACRALNGLFLLEGARLCEDAVLAGYVPRQVFVTATAREKYADRLQQLLDSANVCYEISPEVAQRLSDTPSPQGVFGVFEMKAHAAEDLRKEGKYMALDHVQDPGNLGAIARAGEALGIDGLLVEGGCDIYNPKAQRAAMGALLRLPVVQVENLSDTLIAAAEQGMSTLAAVPAADALPIHTLDLNGGVICVVGNEGNGICEAVKSACQKQVTIPMKGRAESLNAATAAAVLMWEMLRGAL